MLALEKTISKYLTKNLNSKKIYCTKDWQKPRMYKTKKWEDSSAFGIDQNQI
jgi:hypothetical protein